MEKLKPCPFCYGIDVLPSGSMSRTQVWCRNCNAFGPSVFHGGPTDDRHILNKCESEAVSLWNTRAEPEANAPA